MNEIECEAIVAWGPNQPLSKYYCILLLECERIKVAAPQAGEVRVKMLSTSICHTDMYTLSGQDAEGRFPVILGHEGLAQVEQVGEGVKDFKRGDLVIPLYIPECGQCEMCSDERTNLCSVIRSTQGQGLMPNGTSRFTLASTGQTIHHFMGCSTWAEYSVIAAISLCRVEQADPRLCLLGCGVTTGWGAACKVAQVKRGEKCLVIGMGGVGLSVIQGLRQKGASISK